MTLTCKHDGTIFKGDVSTGGSNGAGASVEPTERSSWGDKKGTKKDKKMLRDLIRDEIRDTLKDTGNQGKSLNAHL